MALAQTGVDRFDGILRQADEQTNRRTTKQTNDKLAKMEVVDIGQRTEGRKSCYDVFIE